MAINGFLNDGLKFIFEKSGVLNSVKLVNYSCSGTSTYDDEITQTLSTENWVSGVMFPMNVSKGSEEAILLEQGKISSKDKILYIGSAQLNSSGLVIGIGSPSSEYYTILEPGIQTWETNGSIIYNRLYIRKSLTGSIF